MIFTMKGLGFAQDCDEDVEELGFIYQKHIGPSLAFGLAYSWSRILFWVLIFRHLKIAHFHFLKKYIVESYDSIGLLTHKIIEQE